MEMIFNKNVMYGGVVYVANTKLTVLDKDSDALKLAGGVVIGESAKVDKPVVPQAKASIYDSLTVPELREELEEREIEFDSKLKKAGLVEKLEEVDGLEVGDIE
jgi:hypothetical protein